MTTYIRKISKWPLPWGAILCLLFCLILTGLAKVSAWFEAEREKSQVIFVGDSFVGNYRMHKGERLQDLLNEALGETWSVRNFAWPGARTLDYLLQSHLAGQLGNDVDLLVADLLPNKLVQWGEVTRLDKRGDNLKWLYLDSHSSPVIESLDKETFKKLVIHKMGLLYGWYDVLDYWFVTEFYWPSKRKSRLKNPEQRNRKIVEYTLKGGKDWVQAPDLRDYIRRSKPARDFDLLVQDVKKRKIPFVVLLLPAGNPDLLNQYFPVAAMENMDLSYQITKEWLEERGVAYIDLYGKMPAHHYDDLWHIQTKEGNQIIVDALKEWMALNLPVK